jgi:hypothetical protein
MSNKSPFVNKNTKQNEQEIIFVVYAIEFSLIKNGKKVWQIKQSQYFNLETDERGFGFFIPTLSKKYN